MMIVKVIARTIGLHRLILLNFYPYIQKYVQVCYHDLDASKLHTHHTFFKSDVSITTCSLINEMLQLYLQQQFRPAMIWYIISPVQLIDILVRVQFLYSIDSTRYHLMQLNHCLGKLSISLCMIVHAQRYWLISLLL